MNDIIPKTITQTIILAIGSGDNPAIRSKINNVVPILSSAEFFFILLYLISERKSLIVKGSLSTNQTCLKELYKYMIAYISIFVKYIYHNLSK